MKKLGLVLTVLFVLGMGFGVGANPDTLIIGSGAEATGLDPRFETDVPSFERINVISEPLVKFDVEMNLVPSLATNWEFSEDTLTLTFHLREHVKWHDGQPFTAHDVKYTYEWVLDPANGARNRGLYEDIALVQVVSDHVVEFHLRQPFSFLLNNIARMPITPKHAGDRADFRQNPIGTGPYSLVRWTRDDRMILVAHEEYWGGKPLIKNVIFRPIPEDSTRLLAFEAGEIDVYQGGMVPQELPRLENDSRFVVQRAAGTGYTYLGFNTAVGALGDLKVRQAVSHLIHRDAIVSRIMNGIGTPGIGPIPTGLPWFNPFVPRYEYNPEKARALLAEAGYAEGTVTLRLYTNENPVRMRIAEILQHEARRVGVTIEVTIEEFGAFLSRIQETDDYDIFILGWGGQLDPDRAMMRQFHTHGSNNYTKYSNERLDYLLEQGRRVAPDSKESLEIYNEAQMIVVGDLPYGFINYTEEVAIHRPALKNWTIHPYSAAAWQDIHLVQKER